MASSSLRCIDMQHIKPRIFVDEFKALRKSYRPTKYPIVLCHGILGFDTIDTKIGPKISYWNGIRESLQEHGASVISDEVPPMGTIEARSKALYENIMAHKFSGPVNLVAHSMGGLDARYMAHHAGARAQVKSVTTIATPHCGSPVADYVLRLTKYLPPEVGGFAQLSTGYLEKFNHQVVDNPNVSYFSYGARFKPNWLSVLRIPWGIIYKREGDNDGMVSIKSSMWGDYKGTIENCDHLDVINLTAFKPRRLINQNYSATAMYLHVMDELAGMGF